MCDNLHKINERDTQLSDLQERAGNTVTPSTSWQP